MCGRRQKMILKRSKNLQILPFEHVKFNISLSPVRDELRLTIIEQENKHVFVQVLLKGMMYQLDSMLSLAANTFVYIFLFPITSFYLIPLFTHKCSLIKIV